MRRSDQRASGLAFSHVENDRVSERANERASKVDATCWHGMQERLKWARCRSAMAIFDGPRPSERPIIF